MRQVRSDEARASMRSLLDDVERGEFIGVSRYQRPVAVMVPAVWFGHAEAAMALCCPDCGVTPGSDHVPECDVPACPQTGLQRMVCAADGHDCGEVTWELHAQDGAR